MADDLLQPPLRGDERMEAFDRLIARLSALPVEKPLVDLIDIVTASALPVLGEQLHVMGDEGWNHAKTENDRRALIKKAIELHRRKGTPWAVRTAIDAALGTTETKIEEWFSYDGTPYRFRIIVTLLKGGILAEELAKARAIALETKNVRSHLDGITVSMSQKHEPHCGVAVCLGNAITVWPDAVTDLESTFALYTGRGAHLQHTLTVFSENDI
ncbi:phage tail protein I [uncultured Bilophila sp.]|uniref:phage tail protein I n=1 Tax=uncultured Bilophila sp. TaxID=529385 RepID=UPI0026DBE8A1|nr:phage tail protein I [uncultured Bilophila sp.]